ncbi:hypothetical protein AB8810_08075 [Xanthomonas sp. NCPPB 3005]|uniref:hypothetical protein n=1 Tax=Xanthomonas sp. NCPPB 3005 TaxID=3240913 RepID=UPI0035160EA7
MPSIDPRRFVIVASYLSPGVAVGGGGFVIVGGKVIKVPPKGLRQLQAVYTLLEASDGVSNKTLAQQLQQLAVDLVDDAVPAKGRVAAAAAR